MNWQNTEMWNREVCSYTTLLHNFSSSSVFTLILRTRLAMQKVKFQYRLYYREEQLKIVSRRHSKILFILFFRENKVWYFMSIIRNVKLYFLGKNTQTRIYFKMSSARILNGALRVKLWNKSGPLTSIVFFYSIQWALRANNKELA